MEAHLERIDADIAALTALRSKVAGQVDLHRALASPIRRLVPEVLSEIISATVWAQPNARNLLPMAIKIASVSVSGGDWLGTIHTCGPVLSSYLSVSFISSWTTSFPF